MAVQLQSFESGVPQSVRRGLEDLRDAINMLEPRRDVDQAIDRALSDIRSQLAALTNRVTVLERA